MKENLKSLAWFLAVLFILSVGAELMAEDYDGMPAIKDFEIVKEGEDLNFSFLLIILMVDLRRQSLL